ncbi:MAG: hypothetical protein KDA60_17215, partial [Planctomycetales bacterium]|nr:hypothetical protein [Planctomycetales bacterium]
MGSLANSAVLDSFPTMPDSGGGEGCPGPCPPDEGGSATKSTTSSPEATPDPILLGRGAVSESVVDVRLPTAIGAWEVTRSYSSQSDFESILGNGWMAGLPDMFLEDTSTTELTLYVDSTSKRVFTVSGSTYTAPADSYLMLEHKPTDDIFVLSDTMTQQVWVFNDFDVADPDLQGKLIQHTNRQWWAKYTASSGTSHFGNAYTYDADGHIETVDLAIRSGTPAVATYTYDSGRLKAVSVVSGSVLILAVAYTYYGETGVPTNTDLGASGDLIQVQVLRRATDLNVYPGIVRTTQYRYQGDTGRLKAVYESDAIQRVIDENSSDSIDDPSDILALDDDGATGEINGNSLDEYASRRFVYYTSDFTTNATITTTFGSENLQTKYGGVETSESTDNLVEFEIVGGTGCCGSSGSGVTKQYYYMDLHASSTDPNEVARIVVEDTIASSTEKYRTLYGLNFQGRKLRKAIVESPNDSAVYWCRSWTLDAGGRITEFRMPSAHNVTAANENIDEYLNPYSSSSWSNDTGTLNSSSGLIYVNGFTSDGNRESSRVKQGRTGTQNLVRYNTFLSSTDPYQKNLVSATYTFLQTEVNVLGNGTKVYSPSAGRSFWTDGTVKKWTIQMPSIDSTQNGSGTATEYATYYDDEGRVRWRVDGEGYITYYSYHPTLGSLAYIVRDADPTSLPSNANNQSSKWDADTVGSASSNKPSRSGLPTALSLVTSIEYDSLGRRRKVTDPSGEEHYTVYESNRILQFPHWNGSNGSKSTATAMTYDNGDRLLETYQLPVGYAAATLSGVPIGFASEPSSSSYVSWNEYLRDSITGELVESRRYYDIDGGDYYSTKYEYDNFGRVTKVRQEVQGDGSPGTLVEELHEISYDTLHRPVARNLGTKRGSTETVVTVSETEYDNGGVGDGHVTQIKRYFDATNYTATRFYRTFRGHLRGIVPQYGAMSDTSAPPYTVLDVNWKGQVVASALYTTEPSWTATGSGVFEGDEGYDTFATSYDTGRRRVSEISRDK